MSLFFGGSSRDPTSTEHPEAQLTNKDESLGAWLAPASWQTQSRFRWTEVVPATDRLIDLSKTWKGSKSISHTVRILEKKRRFGSMDLVICYIAMEYDP
jgi:hypothetical protein